MPHSKNSKTRIEAAERHTQALNLRKAGQIYAAIGLALGVSEQRAHTIVTEELQRLNRDRGEAGSEVLRLELERLDDLLAAVWDKARAGEAGAIDRALKVMGRRAALLGLDAPQKLAHTDPTGKKAVAIRLSAQELSDDDLAAIAAGGGGGTAPA
jgi:hypothetical protein